MKTHKPAADTEVETRAVHTGENCPETGWWQALQSENVIEVPAFRFVGQGSPMPLVGGAPGTWVPRRASHRQSDY